MTANKKKLDGRGGARSGSGRKALYGDEKLDEKVPVRLNDDQRLPLVAFCKKKKVGLTLFLREAALTRAGLNEGKKKLGLGLAAVYGTTDPNDVELNQPSLPVKMTVRQYQGLKAYCDKKQLSMGTFVKEAGLAEAKLEKLGVAGQQEKVQRAVT